MYIVCYIRLTTIALLLTVMLGTLGSSAPVTAQEAQPALPWPRFRYFAETGHNIGGAIKSFYDAHGGIDIFGMPLTEIIDDGYGLKVQYFERARFELHPDLGPENQIALTRLGSFYAKGRTELAFQPIKANSTPNADYFPETGHLLGGGFRDFWQANGGLPIFGYPISEEFVEVGTDGVERVVQYFERTRFEYHPEHAGSAFAVQIGQLGQQFMRNQRVPAELTAPVPEIALLGSATTGFATSVAEREHNIARAAAMFDGVIVAAGEEYSFANSGEFSEEGFVEGYAIVGGQLEKVTGGGLCQVSTTMFRAVSRAGLEITHRQGHSFIVNFYENILGFDATVFTPDIDFRWRNNTAYPVYIATQTNIDEATVTFDIWGVSDGRSVTFDGPYTKNWVEPGVPVWKYDSEKPRGYIAQLVHGRSGVDVTLYRTITLADGTSTRETIFTHYDPWDDFYVFGPGVTPPANAKVLR